MEAGNANKRKAEEEKVNADVQPALKKGRSEEQVVMPKGLITGTGLGSMGAYRTNPLLLAALVHTKAEHLRPPENKVFIAERTDKIVDVFKGLVKHNFLSVPVLQKTKHKWYGFVDMADIVQYVVQRFGETQLSSSEDFWALVEKEEEFQKMTVNDLMRYPLTRRNPFHPIKAGYSLLSAIEALAQERTLHRLPVVTEDRQLVNLITQSQVVMFLKNNLDILGDKKNKPVSEIINVIHAVHSVQIHQKAIEAFNLMTEKVITGVAVINEEGKLVGNVSLRDLKGMSTDARLFWRLYQTVENFMTKVKHDLPEGLRPRRVQTCTVDDTLENVITKLADGHIHRVFIIDEAHKPVGVITIKDVLEEILRP